MDLKRANTKARDLCEANPGRQYIVIKAVSGELEKGYYVEEYSQLVPLEQVVYLWRVQQGNPTLQTMEEYRVASNRLAAAH